MELRALDACVLIVKKMGNPQAGEEHVGYNISYYDHDLKYPGTAQNVLFIAG